MTTRLNEQANHWKEIGIFEHFEKQRLLEEENAKEKEEEKRKRHEPTPDLPSLSITASNSIKDVTWTPSETPPEAVTAGRNPKRKIERK